MDASLESKLFLYIVIVFSAVFHEYSHAWMANYLGDPTAKNAGRLTLNPLKHIDPVGTVIIPIFMLFFAGGFIGWAKPVPYNPYNIRDPKFGSTKVAIAGPAANFLIAIIFGLFIRFSTLGGFAYEMISLIVIVNIFLGLFNLIPIPPLDGSKILMDFFPDSRALRFLEQSFIGVFFAIAIAIIFLSPLAFLIYRFIVG